MPLERVAGQAAVFDARAPRAPIAWGGYAAAAPNGVLIGATHERGGASLTRDEALAQLRAEAARLPDYAVLGEPVTLWGAVRAALPDRLPAAGPLPWENFAMACAEFARHGAPDRGEGMAGNAALFAPGLYTLAGLGARGFAHAPLLAEQIASDIAGDPSPLARDGRRALHPARFALRALRRGNGKIT